MSFHSGFAKVGKKLDQATDEQGQPDNRSLGHKLLSVGAPAAAAGLGTYALLRRKRLHGPKGLQEIQKKTDHVMKILPKKDIKKSKNKSIFGIESKFLSGLAAKLDPAQYTSDLRKLKDKNLKNTVIFDMATGGTAPGSANYIGKKKMKWLEKTLGYNKLNEQQWVKGVLGDDLHIPTKTLEHVVKKGKTLEERYAALNRTYPNGWFIKDIDGMRGMETGKYAHYKHTQLRGNGPDSESLRKALSGKHAHKYIVQPIQEIEKEFRVHVLGDKVIPHFTFDRNLGSSDILRTGNHAKVEKLLQKAIKGKKIPKNGLFGMDVILLKNGKIKIIETNPADTKGYSSFLRTEVSSLGHHAGLYKALTGRTAPYRAAMAGAAAAGATAAGANEIDKFVQKSNENPVDGPYKAEDM